jgi:hypothetical protein
MSTKKTKKIKFSFEPGILLDGVSGWYKDLLEEGMDSEEALKYIMSDAICSYYLEEKYPKWAKSSVTFNGNGDFDVELEKLPSMYW